jgi:hypothetical protein
MSTASLVKNLGLGTPSLLLSVLLFMYLPRLLLRQPQVVDDPTGFQEPQQGGIKQQANYMGL